MIGTDLLNDLFTNNVDFVAKQMQTIIDALFPSNEDNSQTDYTTDPILWTGQIIVHTSCYTDRWYEDLCTYNVTFNPYSDSNAVQFVSYSENATDSVKNQLSSVINNTKLFGNSQYNDLYVENNNGYYFLKHQSNHNYAVFNWQIDTLYTFNDKNTAVYAAYGVNPPTWAGESSMYYPSSQCRLGFLGDGKIFVVTPDRTMATNIYNNIDYNNDYHTSFTYTDNDTNIYVGGGAGGIVVSPMGMFNYGEFKLALDSLIDDLNLNFTYESNKLPITEFPSYNDVKYEDMGSFYITPIKQIPTLPLAPDLADTVIDISEPVGVLSDGFGGLLDAYDTLGISLMIGFTFIARLCIRKLRGE